MTLSAVLQSTDQLATRCPFASWATALNCCCTPRAAGFHCSGATVRLATTWATVTAVIADFSPTDAEIVAEPFATAVAIPVALMSATPLSDDAQTIC
jgi:hypothetical protein